LAPYFSMNNENVTIPHRQSFFQILWFKNCKPLTTHQNNGHLLFQKIVFNSRLFISSSYSASDSISYMKGDEVISANSIFKKIKAADKK
jgi:hypothetical protein